MAEAAVSQAGRPLRVLMLRQMTVEPMAPFLTVGGRDFGREIDVVFGQFDTMLQDTHNEALWEEEPDFVVVCPSTERFAPQMLSISGETSDEDIAERIKAVTHDAQQLIAAIRERTGKPILWLGLHSRSGPHAGLADQRLGSGAQHRVFTRADEAVEALFEETYGPGWVVDVAGCANRVGHGNFYDLLRWHQSATAFTPAGFRELSIECLKYIRNSTGGLKKVLALDCDNTLWGGLCGEVDPRDLDLGPHGFPGGAYKSVQELALSLKARGVLLVLVSKNEPENVWRVFDERSEMRLTRDDIAASRINWEPKAENLKSLAEELNLGLDAFVFIDDQEIEIGSVEQFCPEVKCVHLDQVNLVRLPEVLSASGWFESINITSTDRKRTQTYKENRDRKDLQNRAVDMNSYLQELEMRVTVRKDGQVDTERAAQMCQRTNQFNMTLIRYTKSELDQIASDKTATLITIGLQDRFGALGDIGLMILRYNDEEALVDTMLLSCRAFGRRCEDLMLAILEAEARLHKASELAGKYVPADRNGIISDFWQKHGFQISEQADGSKLAMRLLTTPVFETPNVFREITFEE